MITKNCTEILFQLFNFLRLLKNLLKRNLMEFIIYINGKKSLLKKNN